MNEEDEDEAFDEIEIDENCGGTGIELKDLIDENESDDEDGEEIEEVEEVEEADDTDSRNFSSISMLESFNLNTLKL